MDEEIYLLTEQQISAEQSIVGSILIDTGKCLDAVRGEVRAEMFGTEVNRNLFSAACLLQDEGQPVDPVTVLSKMQELGYECKRTYIIELLDMTPTAANVMAYCEVLKGENLRRELYLELRRQQGRLREGTSPQDVSSDTVSAIERLAQGDSDRGAVTASDVMVELWDTIQQIQDGTMEPAMKTGYEKLDRILEGGFQRNGLYILAARPGRGKTTVALNIAKRVAKAGRRVLFISLEMDREQLVSRILATEIGGVSAAQIMNGKLTSQEEWGDLAHAASQVSRLPITFNRQESMNVPEIRYLAKTSRSELLVIDYLGLIENENENGKLYEEVTKTSKRLKLMARGLGVPILCLAQLNRESDKRQGRKPMLSDLRDSGSIEQDADGVIFNYINEETNAYASPDEDTEYLDLIVAKNRHGPTGEVNMVWSKKDGRILEMVEEDGW